MPRKTKKRNRSPAYWWTQKIACLRRDCLRARHAYTKRNIPNHVREIRGLSYKQAKKELHQAIRTSKLSCWRKLIAEVDEDIWGKGYRIVFATLHMGSPLPERIRLEKNDGATEIAMYGGVPQGSILGPTLWNIVYNGVLELDLTERVTTIAYADDLAVVVVANDEEELRNTADFAV
nr:unnamed protein product [Callosobruchus analis]